MVLMKGESKRYKVSKGSKIYEKNKPINEVAMIIKGKASSVGVYGKMFFGSGTVLGLSDTGGDKYIFDYIAEEDCELFAYAVDESHDPEQIIAENIQFSGLMVSTVTKQASVLVSVYDDLAEQCSILYETLNDNKEEYVRFCKKFSVIPGDIEEANIQPVADVGEHATIEIMDYCKNLNEIPLDILKNFFCANSSVTYFNVLIISKLIKDLYDAVLTMLNYINTYKNMLIGNDKKDLFYGYSVLALDVGKRGIDISVFLRGIEKIKEAVTQISLIDKQVLETAFKNHQERMDLLYNAPSGEEDETEFKLHLSYTKEEIEKARADIKNSLERILAFSDMESEDKDNFTRLIVAFINLKDRGGTDDTAVSVRKKIINAFYDIYEKVFFNYFESGKNDTVVEMFLNFGFMDERLLDESQALDLYYLNKSTGDSNIFMLKDWLLSIYKGEEEPSKSEFDIDYQENLREIKKSRLMTPEEERRYLDDQKGKVIYEIQNMFKVTNKITSGKISTFCPVLSKHTLSEDMRNAYVSPQRINSVIENILKIDYSLFYRECPYKNDSIENTNERIMKEVRPYFILMPNFGSRCIMWQDIAGRKKDTPARFVISAFSLESLGDLLTETFARFRWELCKNMQGVRWSDITVKSLTSEYYDYLQFYKKNRELTEKSKEKIKLMIQKKGNNFKEVFAYDYAQWINYEANGAPRLNSYVRAIMFAYCPFPKEMRERLIDNPIYSQVVKKFERDCENKIRRFENIRTAVLKANGKIDEDFEKNLEFYRM